MATKSKLETVFTGDDRPFNKVASRMRGTATKLKGAFKGLGGAMAMMGGGMAIRGVLEKGDRIGKLASRWQVGTDVLQRLGHVAQIGGSDLETVAKAMATVNKATEQAKAGMTSYQREFDALGINVEEFQKLDEEGRIMALSDAFKNADDRARAMAAGQVLLGRGGVELFATFEQGSESLKKLMGEINPATEENIRNIERLNDSITTIKTGAFSYLADILGGLVKAFVWVARRIGREFAVISARFADLVKAAPALFPESMEKWAATMKSAAEMRAGANEWIKMKEAEDRAKEAEEKAGGGGVVEDPFADKAEAPEAKIAAAISKQQSNIFDPRRGGGFFSQAGRTGISSHATKSLGQKMQDLATKTFNENQTTNQLLRDALL